MLKWRDEWRSSHREHGTELFVGIERGPAPVLLGGAAPDLVIASVHYLPADLPTVRGRFFDETYWHVYMKTVLDVASGPQADAVGHMAGYLPINPGPGSTFEERREIEREIAQVLRARLVREGVLRCGGARHSL